MAKKKREAREPEDSKENEVPQIGEQQSEELTDLVVLNPEDSLAPSVTPETAVTLVDEEAGDEVYVILPEGDTSEIPVVETEALDDTASDEAAETSDLAASETMTLETESVIGADTENICPGNTTEITNVESESVEGRETQDLDDLAAELDDQVLAEAAGNTSELLAVPVGHEGGLGSEEAALAQELQENGLPGAEPVSFARSRAWFKPTMAAAALLAISATGFWYMGGLQNGQTFQSVSGVTVPETTKVTPPVETALTGTNPQLNPEVRPTSGESAQGDERLEAKQAFRGRLIAALDLGFGGEVKHE